MLKLTVGAKLANVIILAIFLLVIAGAAGIFELRRLSQQTVRLTSSAQASRYAQAIERDLRELHQALSASTSQQNTVWLGQPLEQPRRNIDFNVINLTQVLSEQGNISRVNNITSLHAQLNNEVNNLIEQGKQGQWNTTYLSLINQVEPIETLLQAQILEIDAELDQNVNATLETVRETQRNVVQNLIFILSGAILILGLASWLLWRNLVQPIRHLTEAAVALADGNLAIRTQATGRSDEIGVLAGTFNSMAAQLQQTLVNLEEDTQRLAVIATLGERLSAILNLEELLVEVVNQVKDKLGYYHAHIYLLDNAGEKLVLVEGTGPAGAEMKLKGYNIPLDAPSSLVARAVRTGQIVSVDNVRQAPDWLPNPLLPDTYSETAVPITLEGQVVGVLDVQQDKVAGLDEGDANLLRSLANQVAVAIRNARLFAEVQTALAEAYTAQEQYLERAWGSDNGAKQHGAYHYQQSGAPLLDEVIMSQFEQETLGRDRVAVVKVKDDETERAALVAPIKLQSQVIGSIQLHDADPSRQWSEWELALIEGVTDQAAQVAENLRLFEETREQASREQTLREITDKMRSTPNLDALLETAARELGQQLGVQHTVLELGIETEPYEAAEQLGHLSGNGQ